MTALLVERALRYFFEDASVTCITTITIDSAQRLDHTRRPMDLDFFHTTVGSETEMDWTVTGGRITNTGRHVVVLNATLGYDFNTSADAVAVALGSMQSDIQPVAGLRAAVHPDLGIPVDRADHDIDPSISIRNRRRRSHGGGQPAKK